MPVLRVAVIVDRDTPDGQTCWSCYRGACAKHLITAAGPNTREAAKMLIRRDVENDWSLQDIRRGSTGRHSPALYSARVDGSSIEVLEVHGQPVNARYGLKTIYEEIRRDMTAGAQLSLF